jgi:tripartite-type tricarboxylate transporter receptor subunit TctC
VETVSVKFIVAAAGILALPAWAQNVPYPSRPIRLVVGFAPGGSTDLVARLVATKLGERVGQQVVVDNRPGASGIIAADLVVKSQPDGYTLLVAGSSISTVGSLYKGITFDVERDLAPLALVATTPYLMVAHPSLGVKSLQEYVAYAKARPGKVSWGASAPGAVQHLSGELFKRLAGIAGFSRRALANRVRQCAGADSAHQDRCSHRACGDHRQAHAAAARCAHHRGIGFPWLRYERLVQHVRSAQNTARHHQQVEQ